MVQRHIASFITESLKDFPAVLVNGSRQVGKSTVVLQLKKEGAIKDYKTLDDITILEAARSDPDGFIEQFKDPVAIDEIQRVPDLLRAIKKSIDADRRPGRFLLTGSANILSYPQVSESLAGRMDLIPLEGLSVREIFGKSTPSSFMEDLFSGPSLKDLAAQWNKNLEEIPPLSPSTLNELIFFGGFPEISLKKELRFRERWLSAYQTAYVERDILLLNQFLDIVSFSKLFRLMGLQTGNLLNQHTLAIEVGLDQRTVARYLKVLELTFQMKLLHPWFSNTRKRLIKTPKVYMNDSAQAAYLMGVSSPENLNLHPHYGALFETWVGAELRKLCALTTGIEFNFYRTHQGKEVDFILSRGFSHWGIECKAASQVTQKDFSGLKDMQEAIGKEAKGLIFYTGEKVVLFSDTLMAVPLRILF